MVCCQGTSPIPGLDDYVKLLDDERWWVCDLAKRLDNGDCVLEQELGPPRAVLNKLTQVSKLGAPGGANVVSVGPRQALKRLNPASMSHEQRDKWLRTARDKARLQLRLSCCGLLAGSNS